MGVRIEMSSGTGQTRTLRVMITVGVLACIGGSAKAEDISRFCVVPVKDGAATPADVNNAWRITDFSFRIPGLPSLVFTPSNRRGQWTIDASRRLVPYAGVFPHSFLDRGRWVREPWSSRVVSVTYGGGLMPGGGVAVLRPGGAGFEQIDPRSFHSVHVLPRRKVSVVTSSKDGPLTVGDRELMPWLSHEQLSAHEIRGIYSLHDAPSLNATVVLDLDRRVYILTDDDEWHRVGTLDKDDYGRLLDAPGSQGVLLAANRSVIFIRKDADGRHFHATVLDSGRSYGASFPFKLSGLFGQILAYSKGGILGRGRGWRRLLGDEFESIPGGDIGLPDLLTPYGGHIEDLPTIGRTMIEGRDAMFLYDGKTLTPVGGGEWSVIGELPRVYDLPSIGRVVVTTKRGMFELTRKGMLMAIPTPFPADGLPMPQIADWPDSGVALVATRSGLFTLDSDLAAKPIPGSEAVGFLSLSTFSGINPGTGEMVLTGAHALFLAVDGERTHDGVCRERH